MNDYFSITDIIVTEERLSAELQQPMPKLGFLSASAKEPDLPPGTKLELPFWLSKGLCTNRNGRDKPPSGALIACELPKIFRESYREILQADACAVELAKWNQHYYEMGLQLRHVHVANVGVDEARRIAEFLLEVFRTRFRVIMDSEQSAFGASAFGAHLPAMERKLLEQGNLGRQQLFNWTVRGVGCIKTSNVLNNIRKRKRMDF